MNNANFPQRGVSVESTVAIVAEYHPDSHTVTVTINGGAFSAASKAARDANRDRAIDVLRELESTLIYQYNTEQSEVERIIGAALTRVKA
jgi:hypothetical protein